jgi:hypothetical protein
MLAILWLKDCASRIELCFLPVPGLCSGKLVPVRVRSEQRFHMFMKSLCGIFCVCYELKVK